MKAEEMFKNLGFTKSENNMDNKDACIKYFGTLPSNDATNIQFPLNYGDVVLINKDLLTYDLINAINKQCEELIELKNK